MNSSRRTQHSLTLRKVYIPPYLAQGLTQPSFTLTNAEDTSWAYGSQHTIDVTLPHGTTSTMKVSLIAGEPASLVRKLS